MDGSRRPAYRNAMTRGTLRIRAIALAAAYAVALQGLLAAFVPVAIALPSGVLCSGQIVDDPASPAGHEPSCASACAMLSTAAAPPPPDAVAAFHAVARAHDTPPFEVPFAAIPRGPQTARAPPAV